MIKVNGKGSISATVIADSISESGKRITTFELEYPRWIHAECKTHRIISEEDETVIILQNNVALMDDPNLSRNAASSRAIPIQKVIEQVTDNPATPIHWGKNQPGMQANGELSSITGNYLWRKARDSAVAIVKTFSEAGYHKQVVNRLLEPFQFIKVVCTATEFDNFFYLRDHPEAQPEIAELARCMKKAQAQSKPNTLYVGEWHLPYIKLYQTYHHVAYHLYDEPHTKLSLEDAIKVSTSMCAQVSYRKSDNSIDKALRIYDQLVTKKPVHASPTEHLATPIPIRTRSNVAPWPDGVTHIDRNNNLWSGNFNGWIQARQLIPGHVYTKPRK